jgi:hypothetical protein
VLVIVAEPGVSLLCNKLVNSPVLPPFMDEKASTGIIRCTKINRGFLGKESEYHKFLEYITWSEKAKLRLSIEQIAANMPSLIQIFSSPLQKLYDLGYDNGRKTNQ